MAGEGLRDVEEPRGSVGRTQVGVPRRRAQARGAPIRGREHRDERRALFDRLARRGLERIAVRKDRIRWPLRGKGSLDHPDDVHAVEREPAHGGDTADDDSDADPPLRPSPPAEGRLERMAEDAEVDVRAERPGGAKSFDRLVDLLGRIALVLVAVRWHEAAPEIARPRDVHGPGALGRKLRRLGERCHVPRDRFRCGRLPFGVRLLTFGALLRRGSLAVLEREPRETVAPLRGAAHDARFARQTVPCRERRFAGARVRERAAPFEDRETRKVALAEREQTEQAPGDDAVDERTALERGPRETRDRERLAHEVGVWLTHAPEDRDAIERNPRFEVREDVPTDGAHLLASVWRDRDVVLPPRTGGRWLRRVDTERGCIGLRLLIGQLITGYAKGDLHDTHLPERPNEPRGCRRETCREVHEHRACFPGPVGRELPDAVRCSVEPDAVVVKAMLLEQSFELGECQQRRFGHSIAPAPRGERLRVDLAFAQRAEELAQRIHERRVLRGIAESVCGRRDRRAYRGILGNRCKRRQAARREQSRADALAEAREHVEPHIRVTSLRELAA